MRTLEAARKTPLKLKRQTFCYGSSNCRKKQLENTSPERKFSFIVVRFLAVVANLAAKNASRRVGNMLPQQSFIGKSVYFSISQFATARCPSQRSGWDIFFCPHSFRIPKCLAAAKRPQLLPTGEPCLRNFQWQFFFFN